MWSSSGSPSDETEGSDEKNLEKLRTRGLVSYPFAQSMSETAARQIIEDSRDTSYVYERPDGSFGVSQIWPIKVNAEFSKNFTVATTNPDPKTFQPQAVVEFRRTIERLFGKGATSRSPIIFAQSKKFNTLPIYKGTAEALQAFLRANPSVCDELKIAKLFPGGFISTIDIGGKKNGFKHFELTAGVEYLLYSKQGYESMACIKSRAQFVGECQLGPRKPELEHGASHGPSGAASLEPHTPSLQPDKKGASLKQVKA